MISTNTIPILECDNTSPPLCPKPHYFAPFVRENIDLYFISKPKRVVILRGDGDQDRPN
ncbi:hypothetical protein SAMN05216391_12120 [Lachnospiraceae bacterium KHCPX20]|nr:hypothetical protein SAMN05216391_12120 [Lachnospiraceae bacterium KHCPX20]